MKQTNDNHAQQQPSDAMWAMRTLAMIALFAVAFFCILGEPTAEAIGAWLTCFIITKGIGAAAIWAMVKLAKKWGAEA